MTEEQLLAQGADEYMNSAQLSFFKQRLIERMQEIRDRIAENQSLCKIERHSDDADNASTEEDRAKALRLIDMDNAALLRSRKALDAITEGEYGFCAETGEKIGLKRLLVVPESLLCVDAMQAREAKGRHQRAA